MYSWLAGFWNISKNHLNFTDFLNLIGGKVYFFDSFEFLDKYSDTLRF